MNKIRETSPKTLLILGTSEKMISRIRNRLELPEVEEIIRIEEITTEEERETARKQRHELGKHIIPAPTFQLKRQFSGYFLDPMRIIRGWRGGKASVSEKTVVRPTFSYRGEYSISDKVIGDVIYYLGEKTDGVDSVTKVSIDNSTDGLKITVSLISMFGYRVIDVARELQQNVAMQVGMMTAFHILSVDIEVKGLR